MKVVSDRWPEAKCYWCGPFRYDPADVDVEAVYSHGSHQGTRHTVDCPGCKEQVLVARGYK